MHGALIIIIISIRLYMFWKFVSRLQQWVLSVWIILLLLYEFIYQHHSYMSSYVHVCFTAVGITTD